MNGNIHVTPSVQVADHVADSTREGGARKPSPCLNARHHAGSTDSCNRIGAGRWTGRSPPCWVWLREVEHASGAVLTIKLQAPLRSRNGPQQCSGLRPLLSHPRWGSPPLNLYILTSPHTPVPPQFSSPPAQLPLQSEPQVLPDAAGCAPAHWTWPELPRLHIEHDCQPAQPATSHLQGFLEDQCL
jgi:hypothetical protein